MNPSPVAFTALFDACVLYPPSIRDLLLSLAKTDLFRARWTARIQDEWTRAVLAKEPGLAEALRRTRQLMEDPVPDAQVTGFETLIKGLVLPDPNDRPVLAATIRGRADVIVTTNLKDFPADRLEPYEIEAQHPDEFISHVLTLSPPVALAAVKRQRARLKNPSYDPRKFIDRLGRRGLPQVVAILSENIELI